MECVYIVRSNEGSIRDTEIYNNSFHHDWRSSYNLQNQLRGKMTRVFGRDAFSKGYIEVYNAEEGLVAKITSYEQLRGENL
ncbi:hypothetical protein CN926_00785 [Bacillus thuringiensis]|uniref:hypothetical protein n=1 Tax=Bacillus thuringiensis TaxID=1428 RepID=UPI000BFC4DE8|nr:hypothetical protein [Bacillus thuringiensis]PGL88571.1 hypothetical protein CN926_00785 [Bacillus thuringiensis]